MFKVAVILAAALAGSGLAAFAVAQESTDDQFMPVDGDPNWYLQRSTCTLAHNVNGNSAAVVRVRIGMGTDVEFLDPTLRDVRQGVSRMIMVSVDGNAEESYSMGVHEEGRQGYRLSLSHEFLDRISVGRRLEATAGGRTLLRLDLVNAATAIGAMRTCYEAIAEAEMNANAMDMDMNFTNAMSEEPDMMNAMDMNHTSAMENAADALENAADAIENAANAARNAATPEG